MSSNVRINRLEIAKISRKDLRAFCMKMDIKDFITVAL